MSLVEAVANVVVGYGVAVVTQILIFPMFGLNATLEQNLQMGAVFTLVSIVRSYALRRVFNALQQLPPARARGESVPMIVALALGAARMFSTSFAATPVTSNKVGRMYSCVAAAGDATTRKSPRTSPFATASLGKKLKVEGSFLMASPHSQ